MLLKIIVVMKAALNFLLCAPIIAMTRVNGDTKCKLYRQIKASKNLLKISKASGVDLTNDGDFQELQQFQDHLSDYRV